MRFRGFMVEPRVTGSSPFFASGYKKRQRCLSISVSGSPKSVCFLGRGQRNEVFIINFRRNLFKHGISLDVADNRTFKVPTCYETVHCTVSPKFINEFGATCHRFKSFFAFRHKKKTEVIEHLCPWS